MYDGLSAIIRELGIDGSKVEKTKLDDLFVDSNDKHCVQSKSKTCANMNTPKVDNYNSMVSYVDEKSSKIVFQFNMLGISNKSDVKVEITKANNRKYMVQFEFKVCAQNESYKYDYAFVIGSAAIDINSGKMYLDGGILTIVFDQINMCDKDKYTLSFAD